MFVFCVLSFKVGWQKSFHAFDVMLGALGVTILYACNIAECPNCKWEIKRGVPSCPNCKAGLRWK